MKMLVIGYGSIAAKHSQALKKIDPLAEIYALRSDKNASQIEGIENIFSFDDLTSRPDFILISNPTALHFETVIKASKFNVPIMVEKPAFHSYQGVEALLADLKKKQILTYVACNLRFHPVIQFLKSQLSKELRVNEVNVYCGSYLPDWRPGKDFRTIYSANAHMGGGVHLDLIHEIDYCYWLFGSPIHVTSKKSNKSSLSISAMDYAHYLLEFEQFNTSITLNYFRRNARRSIELVFDFGTWYADLINSRITDDNNTIVFEQSFQMISSYELQMKYFLECVKKQVQPMNSLEEACQVLKICLQ